MKNLEITREGSCVKREGFTMADRLSRFYNGLMGLRSAFTMAEILLSLTIIGVVAAITLPSLTGNINERTWNTQRKALYSRMSQAISLMPALNGFGKISEDDDGNITEDNVAETFITVGLAKVLKINNICSDNLKDCGISSQIINLNGTKISFPENFKKLNPANVSVNIAEADTGGHHTYSAIISKPTAFETANGESIAVYYNPKCTSLLVNVEYLYMQEKICANLIYDLNGLKGPNTVGKDIGIISVFYPTDSIVVAPIPNLHDASDSAYDSTNVSGVCNQQDSDYRLPSLEEIASISINKAIMGDLPAQRYWSSTFSSNGLRYYLHYTHMRTATWLRGGDIHVRCVKR